MNMDKRDAIERVTHRCIRHDSIAAGWQPDLWSQESRE